LEKQLTKMIQNSTNKIISYWGYHTMGSILFN